MYKFSKTSLERLSTCDDYIQKVLKIALERSEIDFGIAQGERTIEQQFDLYNQKLSRVNPKDYDIKILPLKAKHIVTKDYPKSGAVDVYAFVAGKANWEEKYLSYIAGIIRSIDMELENRMRWGGNFDQDGEIGEKGTFLDMPHHELINR